MNWKRRLEAAFGDRAPDDDVVEELAQHASDVYYAVRRDGGSQAEAEAAVERQIERWVEQRDVLRRRLSRMAPEPPPAPQARSPLAGALNDTRYALRVLRRQPGYTAASVLTLALGIAATTIIFAVLYGVLLKPLPWPGSERLIQLSESRRGETRHFDGIFTNAAYLAWRERPATLDGLAAYGVSPRTLSGAGDAERIDVASVSASLFPLLGARPVFGTAFRESDEMPGAEQRVVVSHALWRARLGASPSAIGRVIRLDGEPYRVIGVMAADFAFPDRDTRAWVPRFVPPVSDGKSPSRTLSMFRAIGRLRAGVTPQEAAGEGTARARAGVDLGLVGVAVFGTKAPPVVQATPLLEAQTSQVRPAILVFFAAVGLLLVTATANVASLQLARAAGRVRETAIRTALGANAGSLLRQFLVESLLIGAAGGIAGIVLAAALHRALPALLPAGFPRLDDITVGTPVIALAAGLSLLSGVAFGLLPALHARRAGLTRSLAEDGGASVGAGGRTGRLRSAIIMGQVAVACVLLVGALLLGRSFLQLLAADRGYNPHNLLTASLPLPDSRYTGVRRAAVAAQLLERVRRVPGVTAVAITETLPLTLGEILGGFTMPAPDGNGTVEVHAAFRHVSPGYFEAMGIRLLAGRTFADTDTPTSPRVAVVNRSFARKYLREPAVGQQVDESLVVGVVDDVRTGDITRPTTPEFYRCYPQMKDGLTGGEPKIIARTAGDPMQLVPTLRLLVREQDASVPLDDISTMENRVIVNLARPRLYAVLLGGFAAFAVIIAVVGLFGVVSYSVAQRTREIGVRTALGARPAQISRMVVWRGLMLALPGVAAGLGLSFAVLRFLSTLLYGVSAYDAASYALVAASVVAMSLLACVVPALRAARTDPIAALHM